MYRFDRGIDKIIQTAMEEGTFDNLPGAGQPLNLDENPYLDRSWQLAYHLLKENNFAPEFIERRQAIEQELTAARKVLASAWNSRRRGLDKGEDAAWVESRWQVAKARFEAQVEDLNKRIKNYNLSVPQPAFARVPIDQEYELAKLSTGN